MAIRKTMVGLLGTACIAIVLLHSARAQGGALPYAQMAERIAVSLAPGQGEVAILRFDPAVMPELEAATRAALEKRGVKVESLAYGPVEGLEANWLRPISMCGYRRRRDGQPNPSKRQRWGAGSMPAAGGRFTFIGQMAPARWIAASAGTMRHSIAFI